MAEDVRIRLSLETSEARRQLGRFREDIGKTADAADSAAESARDNLRATAGATAGVVAAGALGGLARPGGGGADVAFGGIRALQGVLPALGGTLAGAIRPEGGPAAVAIGTAAGAAGAALLARNFGPREQALEAARSETIGLFRAQAQAGIPIDEQSLGRAFKAALVAANREQGLIVNVNSIGDVGLIFGLFGGE